MYRMQVNYIEYVADYCIMLTVLLFFFFSSRRRHTRCSRDWSSDVCSSDLLWSIATPCSEISRRFWESVDDDVGPRVGNGSGVEVAWRRAARARDMECHEQIGRASCRERG